MPLPSDILYPGETLYPGDPRFIGGDATTSRLLGSSLKTSQLGAIPEITDALNSEASLQ